MLCISVPQQGLCGATRWALLLLCGVAVQQAGLWSLYGDLGLVCGLIGGAMVLAGAVGFDRDPGHAARVPSKHDWRTRPYTADERREINQARNRRSKPDLPADATKPGLRVEFWLFLLFYAVLDAAATGNSAACCPATGTVPRDGHRAARMSSWVPPAEATPNAAGREYGWGDRSEAEWGSCEFATLLLASFGSSSSSSSSSYFRVDSGDERCCCGRGRRDSCALTPI